MQARRLIAESRRVSWLSARRPGRRSTADHAYWGAREPQSRALWTQGPARLRLLEVDAVYLQGVVHARDRLFQMDTLRRQAEGKLTELLGPSVVASDVQLRTFGLRRAAELSLQMLSPESRRGLVAYAAGVNAVASAGPLPPEYAALESRGFGRDDVARSRHGPVPKDTNPVSPRALRHHPRRAEPSRDGRAAAINTGGEHGDRRAYRETWFSSRTAGPRRA